MSYFLELLVIACQVLVAGSPSQVAAAIAAAEPYREALIERGVLVVPLPMFGDSQEAAAAWDALESSLTKEDLRWVPTFCCTSFTCSSLFDSRLLGLFLELVIILVAVLPLLLTPMELTTLSC
jgi:hypothetical protein